MYTAWLYFEDRIKDIYFPETDNWNENIELGQFETGWNSDAIFPIRLLEGKLYMTLPKGFAWDESGQRDERRIPADRYFTILRQGGAPVRALIKTVRREQLVFSKYRMPSRGLTIGRTEQCTICNDNSLMSSQHGVIAFRQDGQMEYTDRSSNGTYLNGRKLCQSVLLVKPGDVLTFPSGLKIVLLRGVIAVNGVGGKVVCKCEALPARAVTAMPEQKRHLPDVSIEYHRAPRMMQKENNEPVEIEPPLAKQNKDDTPLWMQIGPSFTMIMPMAMGALATGNKNFSGLAMIGTASAMAVMWGLINRNYRDKKSVEAEKYRTALYAKYISEVEAQLREMNEARFKMLMHNSPNVGECATIPGDTTLRLWERMPTHRDFMDVRLGTGNVDMPIEIQTQKQKLSLIDDPLRNEPERLKKVYSTIADAPVTLSLRKESVVGILGNDEASMLAQGLIMQLATLHSYHDVRIAILTEPTEASRWAWARWLPHVYANEDRNLRMIASRPNTIHEICSHIEEVMGMRTSEDEEEKVKDEDFDPADLPLPHYVVFCTNSELLDNEPLMRRIPGNRKGVTLVMLAKSMELLPKECRMVVNTAAHPGKLHSSDGDNRDLQLEYANRSLLNSFARRIAPIRVKDASESAAIPTMVSFLDTCGVRRVDDLDIWHFWTKNRTYEGLRSVIGYTAGSRPFVLDISENYHGPHGLVAGTTGSGKSVMLQTYILSLAMNYGPQDVQFILIDYKGGGMADAFRDKLPHVAGIIDNLQGSRVIDRALASLNGEIHRREVLFKEVGVKDIIEYSRTFERDPDAQKLPHLVIIADEFAELKSDQPEFMKELVSASRVGRSLGIHLILATQKPSGSVSDEIWANSRFHLCLRVQTVGDSRDMLKRPDAAFIKGTGRCFIQIGNDESFDQVQTCYSGLAYDPNVPRPEEMPTLLDEIGKPVPVPKKRKNASDKARKVTQMDAVLERISQTATAHNIPIARPMWLPEMPGRIAFDDLEFFRGTRTDINSAANDPHLRFLLALADDTAKQCYVPYIADLTAMRSMMIVGLAGTGKTTLVRSIAYSLANRYDPAHLQMYIMSLTSRTLQSLDQFPHVGDIVFDGDTIELKRLVDMLYAEKERRGELFAEAATDSFIEYNRSQDTPVPAIVVFVDRFEQLKILTDADEALYNKVSSLIREGSGRGIHFIVTAMAPNEVPFKLQPFFSGLALQLADRGSYADVLGVRVPMEMPPIAPLSGRALVVMDGRPYEAQLLTPGLPKESVEGDSKGNYDNPRGFVIEHRLDASASITDNQRANLMTEFAKKQRAAWKGVLPKPIPRIPKDLNWELFTREAEYKRMQKTNYELPIGYDQNTGSLTSIDLEENFSMFVTGPKKGGSTNFLRFIARLFVERNAEVHVIGDPDWADFCEALGINLYTQPAEIAAYVHHFQQTVIAKERKVLRDAAIAKGKAAARRQALKFTPYVILIDNVQRFTTDYNTGDLAKEKPFLQAVLSQLGKQAEYYNLFIFAAAGHGAASAFSQEPLRGLTTHKRGFALGGKINEVYPSHPLGLSTSMPNALTKAVLPAGEGYVTMDGAFKRIVTPLIDGVEEGAKQAPNAAFEAARQAKFAESEKTEG